jgi:hypothetical protein
VASPPLTARVRIVVYAALLALVAEESWSAIVHLSHSDFIVFWEAARRLSAHVDPYNAVAASAAAWHQLGVAHPPYSLPYAYLPELAWLLAPLGRLPSATANGIWLGVSLVSIGAGLGVLIAVARRDAKQADGATLLVCAATITVASVSGIAEGQVDGLLLLLAALAIALLPKQRLVAGVVLGVAAAFKPQILWFVPLALLMVREWRTVVGMLIGGLGSLALSLAIVSPAQLGEGASVP